LTIAPSATIEEHVPPNEAETPPPATGSNEDTSGEMTESPPGTTAKADDLIGYCVEAGPSESDAFEYSGIDGNKYEITNVNLSWFYDSVLK